MFRSLPRGRFTIATFKMPPRASLYMISKHLEKPERYRSHQMYRSVNSQIQEIVLVVVTTFKRGSGNEATTS